VEVGVSTVPVPSAATVSERPRLPPTATRRFLTLKISKINARKLLDITPKSQYYGS
jgi:hypothetical protein